MSVILDKVPKMKKFVVEYMLGVRKGSLLNGSGTLSTQLVSEAEVVYGNIDLMSRCNYISSHASSIRIELFLDSIKWSQTELADALNTSVKTLQRFIKKESVLKTLHVELLVMIAFVYERAYEVFEDEAKLYRWMDRPSPVLKFKRPKEMALSYLGCQVVLEELGRIAHGIAV